MAVGEQVTVMAVTGMTVMVAVPTLVVSSIEAALTETAVLAVTASAVNNPLASIVPALVPHETAVLKLPVPVTVTAVMVAVLEPPLQAMIPRSDNKAKIRARVRKPSPRPYERSIRTANEYLNDK